MSTALCAAIHRDRNRSVVVAVGEPDFCLAQIEKLGGADGRHFVFGPVCHLLDFFVDATAPEAQKLLRQAAAFDRAGSIAGTASLDASNWLRAGRRRDSGVLMCMAALAVKQGRLSAPEGERVQAEIAAVLRATERAH